MKVFKEIINALALIGYDSEESKKRNGLAQGVGSFGIEGQYHDVQYKKEHGEFPWEKKLREFDETAEQRRNDFIRDVLS